MSAFDTQVGGDHYSSMAIQPSEYIIKNNLGFCEGNVIKYVSRWKNKNGLQDLEKAKHYLDMLIEQMDPSKVAEEHFPRCREAIERAGHDE